MSNTTLELGLDIGGNDPAAFSEQRFDSLVPEPVFGPDLDESRWRWVVETLAAWMLIVLLLPIMAGAALLIKLASPGPILYSQVRVGRDRRRRFRRDGHEPSRVGGRRSFDWGGRLFHVFKFRSMVINAESNGPQWCREVDPRITPVGKFLRKTHLDELPQLFNVVRGEMSFVGPRPERPLIVANLRQKVRNYTERHIVKPGITGVAQTRQRADLSIYDVRRKVRYDRFYLKKRCGFIDMKLILATVPCAFGYRPTVLKRFIPRILRIKL